MTLLVRATDAHFAWMLGEGPAPDGLRQPPEGVDEPAVLRIVRRLNAGLEEAGRDECWLVVSDGEIVGLCGLVRPPQDGDGEIGFGIAPSRRGKRLGARAVRLLVEAVQQRGKLRTLSAEAAETNQASQTVLARSDFVRTGEREDRDEGLMIQWARAL